MPQKTVTRVVPEAPSADSPSGHTLAELSTLTQLPSRTIRYYVQMGLVDRPEGETRAARYGARHVEQLLTIRKWSESGLSLEAIRDLLKGGAPAAPARPSASGQVVVRSHVQVADGVEVVLDPSVAGLSPEQVRAFVKDVMAAYARAIEGGSSS